MHPIICKIGSFTVYSYGLMLAVAFLAGSYLSVRQAKKKNIDPDPVFNLLFIVFISGLIGARLFYVIENMRYYAGNPFEIVMLSRGGLSWFGGLIAGIISGSVYLKKKKLAFYKIADLVVPFVALAQSIGRLGCFLNGCCFGEILAISMPTQVYSSLVLLIIFVLLRSLQERPYKEGSLFFLYLLLYSAKRFSVEFWRQDNPAILYGLTLFQALSILVFALALLKLIIIHKTK